jgi:putative hemolysin
MGLRYLVGCSSIHSQNPEEGRLLYSQLRPYRVAPEFETLPTPDYAIPIEQQSERAQPSLGSLNRSPQPAEVATRTACKAPKLLRTYRAIGARIAAPPAWDRAFGTIDFLTLLDLKLLSPAARNRFLAPFTG